MSVIVRSTLSSAIRLLSTSGQPAPTLIHPSRGVSSIVSGQRYRSTKTFGHRSTGAGLSTQTPSLKKQHDQQVGDKATARKWTHPREYTVSAANIDIDDTVDCRDDLRPVIEATDDGRFAVLRFPGQVPDQWTDSNAAETITKLHATWLRHNCQCPRCVQRSTGQKLIRPSVLAPSYLIDSIEIVRPDDDDATSAAHIRSDGAVVRVRWREDATNHESEYRLSYLAANVPRSTDHRSAESTPAKYMNTESPLPSIEYEKLIDDEKEGRSGSGEATLRWLHLINEYGICLIRRVPVDDGYVRHVAQLICPIQKTIYGESWDVRSEPRPINVAYSDVPLDFHMDLSYYESPPGIQFLHCVRFDRCVEGGESLFVDAWHTAETMRLAKPDEFRTLTRTPATFRKVHFDRDRPVSMTYRRPHIVVEPETDRIVGVNWAPAFEGPLDVVDEHQLDDYYRAYSTYARLLDQSPTRVETRLEPGDLVCFNNRRVLHARHGFKLNGGSRHLQGCYVNIDEFKSRLHVLVARAKRVAGDNAPPVRHMFNQCWS